MYAWRMDTSEFAVNELVLMSEHLVMKEWSSEEPVKSPKNHGVSTEGMDCIISLSRGHNGSKWMQFNNRKENS